MRGNIIEFNSIVLAAQVQHWGGNADRSGIIPDRFESIETMINKAAEGNDLILLIAGTSAGSEDLSANVIEKLGELLVHGIAVRPGHPVILGMFTSQKEGKSIRVPIIGVPGYPVSAAITCELFVEPLLSIWLGRQQIKRDHVSAQITRQITSPPGDDDYMRVVVGEARRDGTCSLAVNNMSLGTKGL